ncbi:MAG: hypothetical protein WCB27_01555 [Thermoguttaceae bacterium]
MKCLAVALLLPLVLTGQTTGVSVADDRSPVAMTEGFSSRYDMYYANGAASGDAPHESSLGARLGRGVQGYVSQLSGYGEMAATYAWRYWKQAMAFVRQQEKSRVKAELARRDRFDRLAKSAHAAIGAAARREPGEWLYVTSCKYNNGAIPATLGKVTGEHRWGYSTQTMLLAEFCRIDDEACPSFATGAELATLSPSGAGEANQDRKDREQVSAAASWATRLQQWTRWWLGDRDVVFRNISRQIARLDWTTLLTGKHSDVAVHSGTHASSSVER